MCFHILVCMFQFQDFLNENWHQHCLLQPPQHCLPSSGSDNFCSKSYVLKRGSSGITNGKWLIRI